MNAEHREQPERHRRSPQALGLAARDHIHLLGSERLESLEQRRLALPPEDLRRREGVAASSRRAVDVEHVHQAMGEQEWRRPQHGLVHQAEDRCRDSDAERERSDTQDREAGASGEAAYGESDVVNEQHVGCRSLMKSRRRVDGLLDEHAGRWDDYNRSGDRTLDCPLQPAGIDRTGGDRRGLSRS